MKYLSEVTRANWSDQDYLSLYAASESRIMQNATAKPNIPQIYQAFYRQLFDVNAPDSVSVDCRFWVKENSGGVISTVGIMAYRRIQGVLVLVGFLVDDDSQGSQDWSFPDLIAMNGGEGLLAMSAGLCNANEAGIMVTNGSEIEQSYNLAENPAIIRSFPEASDYDEDGNEIQSTRTIYVMV